MMAEDQVTEETVSPIPVAAHTLKIRRCAFRRGHLVPEGDSEELTLDEAFRKLAPTGTRQARTNVVRVRTGQYLGLKPSNNSNFSIINPTTDGDIRWLFQQKPEMKSALKEVYLVEDVVIRRETVDLPPIGGE